MVFDTFDFNNDSVGDLIDKYSPDLIVCFGSTCSMTVQQYIDFLRSLRSVYNKGAFVFETGVYSRFQIMKSAIHTMIDSLKRYIRNHPHYRPLCVHAYAKTERELKHIYQESGWSAQRIDCEMYKCAYYLS